MALSRAFLFVPALLGAAMALAQDKPLNIGDPAPAMKPEGWVKGAPVKSFEKGKVYVVEFWATWCGPCIQSMPHLSDMADKWKGKVEFISVNTWDRNDEGEKTAGNKAHVDRVRSSSTRTTPRCATPSLLTTRRTPSRQPGCVRRDETASRAPSS